MEVLLVRNAPPPSNSSTSSIFYPSPQPLSPSEIDSAAAEEFNSHLTTGILSSTHLSRIFGASDSSEIHGEKKITCFVVLFFGLVVKFLFLSAVGSDGVLRKRVTRDLRDSSNTSAAAQALKEHPEWYCLLYDLNYHPTCAFTMEIQWLVASPSRLNEMVTYYFPRNNFSTEVFYVASNFIFTFLVAAPSVL